MALTGPWNAELASQLVESDVWGIAWPIWERSS